MIFHSFEFLLFFIPVYVLYLVLQHKWQNRFLIVASCIFYAAWNWAFLGVMFCSITMDFFCAKKIDNSQDIKTRRLFLVLSISFNLLILGFFKYFNFFAANLEVVLRSLHLVSVVNYVPLKIILPLGISFYTFEAISYVVDVYRRQVKPAQNYADYLLFVIYFPHLIAGPIMRAKDFLPQIISPRVLSWEKFFEGSHLFFWGLFEKVFIADNLAKIVNPVFGTSDPYNGSQVLIALYAFAFQIFCDFDGYSNMARGLGKCMGFEITINFRLPYFSTNPREFWQRWHISLSSWLRDYLYIPLGGSRVGQGRVYINLFLTMLLGGLWHGASWTFVLWGAYHGFLLAIHRLIVKFYGEGNDRWRGVKTIFFFHAVTLGWLLFRAASIHQVIGMLLGIGRILGSHVDIDLFFRFLFIILPLLLVQWGQFMKNDLMFLYKIPKVIKIAAYALGTYLIIGYGVMKAEEFIYFQF